MKRLFGTLALAAALSLGTSSEAQAQFTFGPMAAYHGWADLGVGAAFDMPMESIHEQVSLWGSFIYFFPDGGGSFGSTSVDAKYWELNGGLAYDFVSSGSVTPFAAAGLNIARFSWDYDGPFEDIVGGFSSGTEIGLSIGGGIKTMLGDSMSGELGGRFEINGGDDFVIEAKLGFPMGG